MILKKELTEQRPRLQLPTTTVDVYQHVNPSYPVSEESDPEEGLLTINT